MTTKETFITLTKELLLNTNTTSKELVRLIRQVAIECSTQLPPILIAYNPIHGRFGVSPVFTNMFPNNICEDTRVCQATIKDDLKNFARTYLARFKELNTVLSIYYKYKVQDVLDAYESHQQDLKLVPAIRQNLTTVESLLAKPNLNTTQDEVHNERVIKTCMAFNKLNFFEKRSDKWLLSAKNWTTNWLKRMEDTQALGTIDLDKSLIKLYEMYKTIPSTPWSTRGKSFVDTLIQLYEMYKTIPSTPWSTRGKSFVDTLETYQVLDWETQNMYHPNTMMFITWAIPRLQQECNLDDDNFDWEIQDKEYDHGRRWFDKDGMEDIPLLFVGRMLASGRYCRLCIKDVPALADYRISEYDGQERVLCNESC